MLLLDRKYGERIVFLLPEGGFIRVSVREIRRGGVRLGIEAPRDLKVFREELLEKKGDEAVSPP